MKSQLIGKAKELHVAGLLVAAGLHVYFPLVDDGFDLVVTDDRGTTFVPVQVKYKKTRTGFILDGKDAKKFRDANVVLAFGSEREGDVGTKYWFFRASEWFDNSEIRSGDNKRVMKFSKDGGWHNQYLEKDGIVKCFREILPKG